MPHFMQFSVAACKCCMLHCVLLDWNGTKWTGNALSIPAAACSQHLLRRNKLPTGCLLFSFLVFSSHDMNVFVIDLTVDNAATHVQGFSTGILMIFFVRNCVKYEEIWINIWHLCMFNMEHSVSLWNCVKEPVSMCGSHTQFSRLTCGFHTQLTCSFLCKIYTGFNLVSLICLNSPIFPTICFT